MLLPTYELEILSSGQYRRVIGIDEVGRGCLAGPVAVGAFEFNPSDDVIEQVQDSKLLKPELRDELNLLLWNPERHRVKYGEVEYMNNRGLAAILHDLLHEIVSEYDDGQTYFLIDGRFAPKFPHSEQIIKGDLLHYSIAAASIIAKVQRDRLMESLDPLYPQYGFAKHKGYATKAHRQAIQNLGICDVHRTGVAGFTNGLTALQPTQSFD